MLLFQVVGVGVSFVKELVIYIVIDGYTYIILKCQNHTAKNMRSRLHVKNSKTKCKCQIRMYDVNNPRSTSFIHLLSVKCLLNVISREMFSKFQLYLKSLQHKSTKLSWNLIRNMPWHIPGPRWWENELQLNYLTHDTFAKLITHSHWFVRAHSLYTYKFPSWKTNLMSVALEFTFAKFARSCRLLRLFQSYAAAVTDIILRSYV